MNQVALQQEALDRATSGESMSNYPALFDGFIEKGIPEEDIIPRVNILTFHAWKAKGRKVKKGQHGVKLLTWVSMTKKDPGEGEDSTFKRPKSVTVFHISQTEEIG